MHRGGRSGVFATACRQSINVNPHARWHMHDRPILHPSSCTPIPIQQGRTFGCFAGATPVPLGPLVTQGNKSWPNVTRQGLWAHPLSWSLLFKLKLGKELLWLELIQA